MPLHKTAAPDSALHRFDPRAKLVIALSMCVAVAMPVESLAILLAGILSVLLFGGQSPHIVRMARRLALPLAVLFVLDWIIVDFSLAVLITARVALLALSFIILTNTTTFLQLFQTLRWLRIPRSAALSLAFGMNAVDMLAHEWRNVIAAQKARGIMPPLTIGKPQDLITFVKTSVPLIVPTVVLATRQAWQISESAYLRGIDRPAAGTDCALRLRLRDAGLVGIWMAIMTVSIGAYYL